MKGIAATVLGSRRDFFWLDSNYAMNTQSPVRGGGFNLNFGGIFTSAPTAVMMNAHRPPVADPGTTPSVPLPAGPVVGPSGRSSACRRPRASTCSGWGSTCDVPQALLGSLRPERLSDPVALDGIFTSAPAAIDWANERVDVFGLGLDHAMYQKTAIGNGAWSAQQARLGGTFTSAASLSSSATNSTCSPAATTTCRGNHGDGTTWSAFRTTAATSSPPVAVSWARTSICSRSSMMPRCGIAGGMARSGTSGVAGRQICRRACQWLGAGATRRVCDGLCRPRAASPLV